MDVTLYTQTVEEVAKDHGMFVEDLLEIYGEDAVRIYGADSKVMEGDYTGVQYKDGTYAVYASRFREEGITFGRMLEVIFNQFSHFIK